MSRLMLPGLTVVALLGASITASAQGLKELNERREIAVQRLTTRVADAIELSRKQDPGAAKVALNNMLAEVRDSQDLLQAQRASLNERLQARLSVVNTAIRTKNVKEVQPAPRDPDRPKSSKGPVDPRGGVYSVVKDWTVPLKRDQLEHAALIARRQAGIQNLNMRTEAAAVIPDGEIAFPPYWKRLTEERKKLVGQQLTEKEVKLLKTLNSVMSVDYDDAKFKAVLSHIQEKTNLTIIVDEASLQDAMTDYDAIVNFKVEKVTVRTLLKKILGDKGLTYIIKEGTIQVMTPKKASEHTVVRTYQIDDLVAPDPQMAAMFGPFMAQQMKMQNAQILMNLIQMTVSPDYWQPNGPGSMAFYPPTNSLIIRASAEMHYQMAAPGLFGGR